MSGGLTKPRALCAAAATGFGVMAAELTAVRLLAPHFGDSAYVWTNVIGVILAAMATGAALGGRICSWPDASRWPGRLLSGGALLLAAAPWLAGWFGQMTEVSQLPLDAAMPALIRGSLVASAVVFAPPMLLLAAVSPLLVALLSRSGVALGRAAGDLAAAGTLGSLLGTFLATHVLVPSLGCRLAMLVAAGVLVLGALVASGRRERGAAAAALLLVVVASWVQRGPLRAPPAGVELLAERETPYQFLQVHRQRVGEQQRTTLVINEGLDSFHSLAIEGSVFTDGNYYDWHALAPLLVRDGRPAAELRAASIGDGAGSLRKIYGAVHPGLRVDSCDLDGQTMLLGDEFFDGDKAEGARYALDGRLFLTHSDAIYDVIHVDAYAHQVYVPAHLASVEFFEHARRHLCEGGVLACNVGALSVDDAVLRAVVGTMASVFEDVAVMMVPRTRNALVVACRNGRIDPSAFVGAAAPAAMNPDDRDRWSRILAHAADAARWQRLAAPGPILRDDRPLLDQLLSESYVKIADPGSLVVAGGDRRVADAEQVCFEAAQRGDWGAVLTSLAESEAATAWLRLQAGDARWRLRQLRSAALEYREALRVSSDPELKATLSGRIEAVTEDLAPILAADAVAAKLGWWSAFVLAAGLALVAGVRRV